MISNISKRPLQQLPSQKIENQEEQRKIHLHQRLSFSELRKLLENKLDYSSFKEEVKNSNQTFWLLAENSIYRPGHLPSPGEYTLGYYFWHEQMQSWLRVTDTLVRNDKNQWNVKSSETHYGGKPSFPVDVSLDEYPKDAPTLLDLVLNHKRFDFNLDNFIHPDLKGELLPSPLTVKKKKIVAKTDKAEEKMPSQSIKQEIQVQRPVVEKASVEEITPKSKQYMIQPSTKALPNDLITLILQLLPASSFFGKDKVQGTNKAWYKTITNKDYPRLNAKFNLQAQMTLLREMYDSKILPLKQQVKDLDAVHNKNNARADLELRRKICDYQSLSKELSHGIDCIKNKLNVQFLENLKDKKVTAKTEGVGLDWELNDSKFGGEYIASKHINYKENANHYCDKLLTLDPQASVMQPHYSNWEATRGYRVFAHKTPFIAGMEMNDDKFGKDTIVSGVIVDKHLAYELLESAKILDSKALCQSCEDGFRIVMHRNAIITTLNENIALKHHIFDLLSSHIDITMIQENAGPLTKEAILKQIKDDEAFCRLLLQQDEDRQQQGQQTQRNNANMTTKRYYPK